MEVIDKDSNIGFNSTFRYAIKSCNYFFHIAFLETCKTFNVVPSGLVINKKPFIEFSNHEMDIFWKSTVEATEQQLLETLIVGVHEKMTFFEIKFWDGLKEIVKDIDRENVIDWLVKLLIVLEKEKIV